MVRFLVQRAARSLFGLFLLPAVVLGSVCARAILIHEHHGHDLHGHSLALGEVDDWRHNAEHGHDEHGHDGLPEGPAEDDSGTAVIVLDLPDALARGRGLSTGTVVARGLVRSPVPVAVTPDPAASGTSLHPHPWPAGPDLRPGSAVAGILLTNHALLL